MTILALDLGTYTGWAVNTPTGVVAGTHVLATPKDLRHDKRYRLDRRMDRRVIYFSVLLREMVEVWDPRYVVFEDVRFASSQAQAHLWGSFRGALWAVNGGNPNRGLECLETGKLKKFATGNGGADKAEMATWLLRKEPHEFIRKGAGLIQRSSGQYLDDNAIDAIHLLRWAQSIYEK